MKRLSFLLVSSAVIFLAFSGAHADVVWLDSSFNYTIAENGAQLYVQPDFSTPNPVVGPTPTFSKDFDSTGDSLDSVAQSTAGPDSDGLGLTLKAGASSSHLANGVRTNAYLESSTALNDGIPTPFGVEPDGVFTQQVISFSARRFEVDGAGTYTLDAQMVGGLIDAVDFFLPPPPIPTIVGYNWSGDITLFENITDNSGNVSVSTIASIDLQDLLAGTLMSELVNLRTQDEAGNAVTYDLKAQIDLDSMLVNFAAFAEAWTEIPSASLGSLGTTADPLALEATITDIRDIDNDGDGYSENQGDCDDADDTIFPGATEVCGDGIDQDCHGADALCAGDLDDDEDGYTENEGDCNDSDNSIYPGATEVCGDGIDQDCDGSDLVCAVDPKDTDDDDDGTTENQGDCDDSDNSIYPGATEICGDGIDQDCDGSDLVCGVNPKDTDDDDDGTTENQGDCDDSDNSIYPGATEVCGDGIDQDCDGSDLVCAVDPKDTDDDDDGTTENQGDCDDSDNSIYPGATEVCGDGIDQDCDGSDLVCAVDPKDTDDDADGTTENQGDCDDSDNSIYPGATEVCGDGIDQNCDGSDTECQSSIDGGYKITSNLWAKAVLKPGGGDVTLIWKEVGTDITPNGSAQVVSGYFYADPDEFAHGSIYNPEIFVKVYIASNGWANIAFNHVTVDDVDVYTAHQYGESADKIGTVTLNSRLAEHQYTGVAIDTALQTSTVGTGIGSSTGYTLTSDLWAKAILQVSGNPVTLIWKAVGSDTTHSGARVVSGYFYADPNEFAYGSVYNPEIFVKAYIASNGWANIAFNHVTIGGVDVSSAHNFSGLVDQFGTVTLKERLVEHQYTGVGLPQ